MEKKYLRTKLATDWSDDKPGCIERLIFIILWFIPQADPDYEDKMHLIDEWLIEFIDGEPWREIGLDSEGRPVVAGPDKRNYGFWNDTNMKYEDFTGESLEAEEFERSWIESGVIGLP